MSDNLQERADAHSSTSLKDRVWRVIFLTDTRAGRIFDITLLWLICLSVLVIMFESIEEYQNWSPLTFNILEWVFTILFTIEYFVRIWVAQKKKAYVTSFFGIVDLLSILPTYLALLVNDVEYLVIVRILRLLRIFRILKMVRHLGEANQLLNAIRASGPKVTVFILCVVSITMILGSFMYVIEGVFAENEGFANVPESIYWAIVTISTLGYGDITPVSPLGKIVTTFIVLLGYGVIAVPTGIVTAELNTRLAKVPMDSRSCKNCGQQGHDTRAAFCKMCGGEL